MVSPQDQVTPLSDVQQVELYPTYGAIVDGQQWRVSVAGRIFQPGALNFQTRIMLRLLQRVMRANDDQFASDIFQQRIFGFMARTQAVRSVVIRVGEQSFTLPKTRRNGQFEGHFRIDRETIDQWKASGIVRNDQLPVEVMVGDEHPRRYQGQVQLISNHGVSVVSDIDDTIKHTQVDCRRTMLENTFLREFLPVGGMVERYREWSADGTAFHYVSSSPWQLFRPLWGMIDDLGFPEGTVHLRSFRIRDHMLRHVMLLRRNGKSVVIHGLLNAFQGRRFVLVGDSGEKDPKIYAHLAREFPDQVQAIYIRQLEKRPMTENQARRVFRKLPNSKWQLFQCPSQLPDSIADAITPSDIAGG